MWPGAARPAAPLSPAAKSTTAAPTSPIRFLDLMDLLYAAAARKRHTDVKTASIADKEAFVLPRPAPGDL